MVSPLPQHVKKINFIPTDINGHFYHTLNFHISGLVLIIVYSIDLSNSLCIYK